MPLASQLQLNSSGTGSYDSEDAPVPVPVHWHDEEELASELNANLNPRPQLEQVPLAVTPRESESGESDAKVREPGTELRLGFELEWAPTRSLATPGLPLAVLTL